MGVQNNVRRLRISKGITQVAVASCLGISKMRYYRFENINKTVNSSWLPIIAEFMGLDVNIFFSEELTDSVIKRTHKIKQKEAAK